MIREESDQKAHADNHSSTARVIFSRDELRELAERMRAARRNGGDKRA